MALEYTPPDKKARACRHWWFGAWDCLVNLALRAAGVPVVRVGPGETAIDLHVHSMFSRCSISRPDRIMLRAAALGFGGVGIMDHTTPKGIVEAERCCEYLKDRGLLPGDFILVTGVEISTTKGHVGGLFVRDLLPIDVPTKQTVAQIHDAGGLAVANHPFSSTGVGEAVFDYPFDAVEICSGSTFSLRSAEKGSALLTDPRLASAAKLGSSDAHYLGAIGSCYSVFELEENTAEGVRRAILSGRVSPRTSRHYYRLQRLLGRISKLK